MGRNRHGGRGRGGGRGGGGGDDGEGGGGGGGGYSDQFGEGWGGGHGREHDGGGRGRGAGRGGGGGTGGGDAGQRTKGPNLTFQRQLPKFLQPHAHLLARPANEEAPVVEDYSGAQRRVGDIGDEDDVAALSRAGLGSRPNAAARSAAAMAADDDGPFAGVATHAAAAEAEAQLREALAKEEKGKGNRAFQESRFEDAIRHFSACIAADPSCAIYYSNRSAAHAARRDWAAAAADAARATDRDPAWPKGWARAGAAAMGAGDYTDAREAYAKAAELEPGNEAYHAARDKAEAAEAAALAAGQFRFRKRPKTGDAPGAAAALPAVGGPERKGGARAAAGVRDRTLLSFAADDDEAEDEEQ